MHPIAIQGGLRCRLGAQRIAEKTGRRGCSGSAVAAGGKYELRTERPFVDETVAQHAHHARVVKDAEPSAYAGLTDPVDVVGKSNSGSDSLQIRIEGVFRHPRVANAIGLGEEDAGRSIGIDLGGNIRRHRGEIDLREAIAHVAPGQSRLITEPQIQRQTPHDTVVVLDVNAGESIPVMFELTRPLLQGVAVAGTAAIGENAGEEELVGGERRSAEQIVILGPKSEDARLIELVVEVDPAALDGTTKMQVVFPFLPPHIVAPREVISREEGGRVISEGEPALHSDSLDRVRSGFKRESGSERSNIDRVGSRTSIRYLA